MQVAEHDIEICAEVEQLVIGCLLVGGAETLEGVPWLRTEHFYLQRHRTVFEVMRALALEQKHIDIRTVFLRIRETRRERDIVRVQGESASVWLSEAVLAPVSIDHVPSYAKMLVELASKRAIARRCATAQLEAKGEVGDVVAWQRRLISDLEATPTGIHGSAITSLDDIAAEASSHIHQVAEGKRMVGISTGFPSLDKAFGGWRKKKLLTFSGRPGGGKSAFIQTSVGHVLAAGHRVAVFNFETPRHEVLLKIQAAHFLLPIGDMLLGPIHARDAIRALETMKIVRSWPLSLAGAGDMPKTPWAIRDAVEELSRQGQPPALVVIDHVHEMRIPGCDSERQMYEIIVDAHKAIAEDFDCCVVQLAQMTKEAKRRTTPPQQADIKEGGAFEEKSSVIGFVHHEYDKDGTRKSQLGLEKNRDGEEVTVPMHFRGEYVRFDEAVWGDDAPRGRR